MSSSSPSVDLTKYGLGTDQLAELFDRVCVSAGKVGAQVELNPQDLIRAAELTTADLVVDGNA